MRRLFLTFITLICAATIAVAAPAKKKQQRRAPQRTSQTVKDEKKATAAAIKETARKIDANTKETSRQLNQLNQLRAEIAETEADIKRVSGSVDSLSRSILVINTRIGELETKVVTLKDKYAVALKRFQGHRQKMNALAFVFSAKSFDQAYRRMRYLQQFSRWRQRKTEEIRATQAELATQREALAQAHNMRNASLKELTASQSTLKTQQAATDKLVASLRKEGGALKAYMRQKEQEARQLDAELDRLIAAEIKARQEAEARAKAKAKAEAEARAKAEAEAKAKAEAARAKAEAEAKAKSDAKPKEGSKPKDDAKPKDASKIPAQPTPPPSTKTKEKSKDKGQSTPMRVDDEDVRLDGDFENNRGRLPFPVTGAFKIVKHFGRQHHPDLKYVETDNSGIDIQVSPGGKARAIFPGKVSAIFRQPGFNTIVMVRHGSYITIYAGLSSISVKTGDTLKSGQTIGSIYADPDDDGRAILHFELRRERQKLNPEEWLR